MAVDQAAAFEQTLERIRERYALYFHLPEGMQPSEEHSVDVSLTDAARRRYTGAEVRYRRSYLAPNGANETEHARRIRLIHLPLSKGGGGARERGGLGGSTSRPPLRPPAGNSLPPSRASLRQRGITVRWLASPTHLVGSYKSPGYLFLWNTKYPLTVAFTSVSKWENSV
jgi:hypothetical protein